MHLRRALLLMALVLGAVALVEALVTVPRQRSPTDRPTVASPAAAPAPAERSVVLRYPPPRPRAEAKVPAGAHVVIEVATSVTGQASLSALGLVQSAEPATPARFDLLATRPGSYDVTFEPVAGPAARVGRLVVRASG